MKVALSDITPRITVKPNRQSGIQNFGEGNVYAQAIDNAVKASGRATQCIKIFNKFVRGQGFPDPFYKVVVNRNGLTVDKLHREIVKDYTKFFGFAIHFNYNALGQIISMKPIPFKELRLGLEDDNGFVAKIKHHPDWGREFSKNFQTNLLTEIDVFNPDPDVVMQQAEAAGGFQNYKGQILWWSNNGWKYPEATCDPVLEDVISDNESKNHRQANLVTNFMAAQMLEMDEYENDDDEDQFVNNLKSFQGGRQAGKIMVMFRKKGEALDRIKMSKVDIQDQDRLFEYTNTAVKESIRGNFLLPAVLVSDLIAGKLGTAQEMKDSYDYFNAMTTDDRLIFEEVFSQIFQYWHVPNVNASNNYAITPLTFSSTSDVPAGPATP